MKRNKTTSALPAKVTAIRKTGPTTLAGKKKTSMNALKYGLTARQKILPHLHEKAKDREQFDQAIADAIEPRDAVEWALVDQLADLLWNQKRVQRAEVAASKDAFAQFTNLSLEGSIQGVQVDAESVAQHAAIPRQKLLEKIDSRSTHNMRGVARVYSAIEMHRALKPGMKLVKLEKSKTENGIVIRKISKTVRDE